MTEGTSLSLDLLVAGADAVALGPGDSPSADGLEPLEQRLVGVERRLRELDDDRETSPEHATGDGRLDEPGREDAALDDDIAATEEQLAAAKADEARLITELEALSEGPSHPPGGEADADPADRERELEEARRRRRHAQAELDAATTTATVLRLGIERSIGDGPAWMRWVQPVALAVASASVLVAVALLTSGVSRAGIAVAVVALLSAAASLVLPTRPLREPQDVTRMRTRLEQADEDIRFWDGELSAQTERATAIASSLGLPADVGDDAFRHLGPTNGDRAAARVGEAPGANRGINDGVEARTRELSVARNTASAAAERVTALRRERDLRTDRTAPTAGAVGTEAGAAGATCSLRAVLRQEHRGLADELNRRRWTHDRRAVATWLLAHSAAGPTPPAHAAEPPDATVDPPVDPPEVRTTGRTPEHPVDPGIRVLVTPAE